MFNPFDSVPPRFVARQVWALGIMIYEMAYGTPPWRNYPNDVGLSYDPAAIPLLPSEYPPAFRMLYRNMLLPSPGDRPSVDITLATAEAFLPAAVGPMVTPITLGDAGTGYAPAAFTAAVTAVAPYTAPPITVSAGHCFLSPRAFCWSCSNSIANSILVRFLELLSLQCGFC